MWLAEAERTLGVTDHLEANLSSLGQFTLQQDAARNLRILTQYDKRDEKVGRKGRNFERPQLIWIRCVNKGHLTSI